MANRRWDEYESDYHDRMRGRMPRWDAGDRERGWRNQEEGYRRDYEDPFYDRGSSPAWERGYGYRAGYGPDPNENAWRRGERPDSRHFEGPPPRPDRGWNDRDRGREDRSPYSSREYGRDYERGSRIPDGPWTGAGRPYDRERWGNRDTGRGYGRGGEPPRGGEYEGRGYSRGGVYDRMDRGPRDFMDRGSGRMDYGYDYEDEPVRHGGQRNDRTHDSDFDDYRYGSGRYGGDRNW